jgi:hypothetical protein
MNFRNNYNIPRSAIYNNIEPIQNNIIPLNTTYNKDQLDIYKNNNIVLKNNNNENYNTFVKPQTKQEWQQFHKTNEINMKKAYDSDDNYYIDNNKLYIAGTKNMDDVLQWPLIAQYRTNESNIYKNAEKVLIQNPQVDTLIGHSMGGSVILELEQRYNKTRPLTSITYNAPVFSPKLNNDYITGLRERGLRFRNYFDPVSYFDNNARTSFRPPDFSIEYFKSLFNLYQNPNIENINDFQKNMFKQDPVFNTHKMTDTYSKDYHFSDYMKSAGDFVMVTQAYNNMIV